MSALLPYLFVVGIALLVMLAVAAYRSLRLAEITFDVPVEEQESPGKRPWWVAYVPWGRRLCAVLERIEHVKQSDFDNQTRYKILTDNVAAAVVMHQPDGMILWCGPYTEVLTGYSLAEIYGEKEEFLLAHVHEEDKEAVRQALSIVSTGEPFQYRYRFYHKSGLVLWFETRTVPIFDQLAHEYVALSITLDVTASVNSQRRIEERNRDLSEFTYMISHDLKAPIVTLRGMLEVVRDECGDAKGTALSEPIEFMSKAIHRLEQLVGGVLELAQVSATEKALEPVDLRRTVAEVIEDYRLQIDAHEAHVTAIQELPWVLGNSTQLYQIFSNLIGNAIKYRQPGRPLHISITSHTLPSSRRRTIVSIQDNGRGIPEEYREAIFKPFNRAGEQGGEGSGIGLACVKRIVEKLGGAIRVDSAVGEGSTFTIELRRASEEGKSSSH